MSLPTLNDIACRVGTDKSTLTVLPPGPEGFTSRSSSGTAYAVFYQEYFHRLRADPVRLLEIGVLDGRSLAMWTEYFEAGRIYGLDLDPACTQFDGGRASVFIGSQDDAAVLASIKTAVPEGFDVVIDDGSHYVKHMIASFNGLFDHVQPRGYYVIEDINVAAFPNWGNEPFNRGMAMQREAGNDAGEMLAFLKATRARPDVAEFAVHQRSICFVRKRADGDRTPTYTHGDSLDHLFPPPSPRWRRMARWLINRVGLGN